MNTKYTLLAASLILAGCGSDNDSAPQQHSVNSAPIANSELERNIAVGNKLQTISLDGSSSSDPDGDPLSYTWQWVSS